MGKYSCYEFEIFKDLVPVNDLLWEERYYYNIYIDAVESNEYIESDEYFDTEQQARFAAVGHIEQLENGPE